MKNEIQRVMKACNENSPQPAASMVKFHEGKLVAYGGTFCLQIPVPVDAECAFKPSTLLAFYRKDRSGAVFKVAKGKLKVRHKRESVTLPCLPQEEMPILDVHREPRKTKWINNKALKSMIACVDSAHHIAEMQGVCLRDGWATATDGKVMLSVPVDIGGIAIGIPIDSVKFLATCTEKVTGFAFDGNAFKLWFDNGMTFCTRVLGTSDYPNIDPVFEGNLRTIELSDEVADEIRSLNCDVIELSHRGIRYQIDKDSMGVIKAPTEGDEFCFTINKKNFDVMFDINRGNILFTKDNGHIIIGNGGKFFKSACAVMAISPFE